MGSFDPSFSGEHSFVIPRKGSSDRIFTMHEGGGNPDLWKKIALAILLVAFFGSMALIFWRGKQLESVADVRNFAVEELPDSAPWSFDQYPVSEAQTPQLDTPLAIGTVAPVREVTPTPTLIATTPSGQVSVPTRMATAAPASIPQNEGGVDLTGDETADQPVSQPLLSCNRVEWFKGALNITGVPNAIVKGDTIRFVGSASATDVPIKSLTFRHSIGGQVIAEVERPARFVDAVWVADYTYVFETYGQHRITVTAVTPE